MRCRRTELRNGSRVSFLFSCFVFLLTCCVCIVARLSAKKVWGTSCRRSRSDWLSVLSATSSAVSPSCLWSCPSWLPPCVSSLRRVWSCAVDKAELLALQKQLLKLASRDEDTYHTVTREQYKEACLAVGIAETDREMLDRVFTLLDASAADRINFRVSGTGVWLSGCVGRTLAPLLTLPLLGARRSFW